MDGTRRNLFGALLGTGAVVTAAATLPAPDTERPWMTRDVHCPRCASLIWLQSLSFNSSMTAAQWREKMTTPQHITHVCGWEGDVTFGVFL